MSVLLLYSPPRFTTPEPGSESPPSECSPVGVTHASVSFSLKLFTNILYLLVSPFLSTLSFDLCLLSASSVPFYHCSISLAPNDFSSFSELVLLTYPKTRPLFSSPLWDDLFDCFLTPFYTTNKRRATFLDQVVTSFRSFL